MKKTRVIKKLLESNYNLKIKGYDYFPNTNDELKVLVDTIINRFGYNVDLNNVYVSRVNDFRNVFFKKNCLMEMFQNGTFIMV
jgi:hypothetical protein